MAAATLAEDGRLDVDAPVGGVLPWLPAPLAKVTTRQLAAHIGGVPHYAGNDLEVLGRWRYPTARDAVSIFSGRALLAAPGDAYSYSSWGYTLIGAVIEAQAGQHFLDYIRHHVTNGLTIGADGDVPEAQSSRLYDIENDIVRRMTRTDMSYTWPGGGLAATPEALAAFGGSVLEHAIISPAHWQAMLQPTRLNSGAAAHERDYDIGFGWRIGRDRDADRIVHHAGITTGARSVLVLWPEHETAATVLSNAAWISTMEPTASLLAAPFRAPPAGLVAAACPAPGQMTGALAGQRFQVEVAFHSDQGRCVGELPAPAPLRTFFAKAYQWPDQRLRIIALSRDGTLSRAALVTPFGLYDLRAQPDGRWTAVLNQTTTLELMR